MQSAIDSSGSLINIYSTKGADGVVRREGFTCQCCNEPVVVAFGSKRQYFRHKSRFSTCIAAEYDKHMSEWHRSWQNLFPEGSQEIYERTEDGSFRRADVSYKNYVVEFQHSAITDEEVIARTSFYENQNKTVIWIFDQRSAWILERDFRESNMQIQGLRLLEYKSMKKVTILPRGMAQIDTTKTILFAEIVNKKQEKAIIRLFAYNGKLYAINYGKSREKLVDKIITDKLRTSIIIEPINEESKETKKKNRKEVSEERRNKWLDKIISAQNSSIEEKEVKPNEISFDNELINKLASIGKLVTITNSSSVDMTRMIEFGLRQIDCCILDKKILTSNNNYYKIEYMIQTNGQSRAYILQHLDSLANDDDAMLYGGHFQ